MSIILFFRQCGKVSAKNLSGQEESRHFFPYPDKKQRQISVFFHILTVSACFLCFDSMFKYRLSQSPVTEIAISCQIFRRSLNSFRAPSVSCARTRFARTLPSCTPSWSKLFTFHTNPWNIILFSKCARSAPRA